MVVATFRPTRDNAKQLKFKAELTFSLALGALVPSAALERMTIELTPNPPRPSSCAPDGVHPEARSRFVEPANGGGKREQRSGSHVNSLPKPLMIHDWYAWCGALHLRRRAANFSDGDRSPSVTLTLHSTAGDPATLRAGPPASSSAARSRSMTFSRPTPSSARSTTKIDKGVAEAGHPLDGALTVAHAF